MVTIELTKGQTQALEALRAFVAGPGGTFYLAGVAGSGKSTVLGEAVRIGVLPPHGTAWCAPSWKAAMVLRSKAGDDVAMRNATSFHSVVYSAPTTEPQCENCGVWKEDEYEGCEAGAHKWVRALRFDVDSEDSKNMSGGILLVDEASMLTRKMLEDAQLRGWSHIVLIGDTYQLPPPTPPSPELRSALAGRAPDVELTEVMRTALDSPILRLATDVRENGWVRLPAGHPLLSRKGGKADVIITGTHKTRVQMAQAVRRQMGLSALALPRKGERLMVCANYRNLGIYNKTEITCASDGESISKDVWKAQISFSADGGRTLREDEFPLHRNGLVDPNAHKSPEWEGSAEADRRLRVWLAYAITGHSSQGSEWQNVGIVNEAGVFRDEASKWLYTVVTRARENLWVMQ